MSRRRRLLVGIAAATARVSTASVRGALFGASFIPSADAAGAGARSPCGGPRAASEAARSEGSNQRALRVAATDNRVCRSGYSFTYASRGRQTAVATRYPFVIGSGDRDRLVVCLDRWFRVGAAERAPLGNVTMEAVIENAAGTRAVRVRVAGSSTIALAAGAAQVLSDPIVPTAFGLAAFVKGSTWYWKDVSLFDAPSGEICENGFQVSDDPGARCFCYDPASRSVSSVDAPGPFETIGDTASHYGLSSCYRPTILGTFVAGDPPTLGAVVDSIVATGQGDPGGGYGRRAAQAATGGPLAWLNLARDGGDLTQVEGNTKTAAMYRYASIWIAEAGANDLIYSSLARFQATERFTYAAMRAAGVRWIIRPAILPRTDSSDRWSTAAGQRDQLAAWQRGGAVDQANAWFAARLADDTVDFVPVFSDLLDPATPQRWRSDGTPCSSTIDGTHPSAAGSAAMARRIAAILDSSLVCNATPHVAA